MEPDGDVEVCNGSFRSRCVERDSGVYLEWRVVSAFFWFFSWMLVGFAILAAIIGLYGALTLDWKVAAIGVWGAVQSALIGRLPAWMYRPRVPREYRA